MEAEARRELARLAAEGLDAYRESLWLTSLTYLTDACAALGDEATAALVYPELEPLAGTNVMIGHLVSCYGAADRYLGDARGDARRAGSSGEALRACDGAEPAHGSRDLARTHGLRVRTLPARARVAVTATRPGHCSARPGHWPGGSACRRSLARARSLGTSAPPAAPPGRSVSARGPDPRPRRPGPQQPGDRHDAHDQRAHGRQPHTQHPAQDRLLQSHRGRLLRPPAPSRFDLSHAGRYSLGSRPCRST